MAHFINKMTSKKVIGSEKASFTNVRHFLSSRAFMHLTFAISVRDTYPVEWYF